MRHKKTFGQILTQKLIQGLNVGKAYRYTGISRQVYCKHQQSETRQDTHEVRAYVLVNHSQLCQPHLDTYKLQHVLRMPLAEAGVQVGRDHLLDALRAARLPVVSQRAYHKAVHSHYHFRRHPDLSKGGPSRVIPAGPKQVWVVDIIYLLIVQCCACLGLVADAYSCRIVGYRVCDGLHAEPVVQALRMALKIRRTRQPPVHHLNRGIQYCSAEHQHTHQRHGIMRSMTDGHDCYQNALAEQVNDVLKEELLFKRPTDLEQAVCMVVQAVHVYNRERPHLALKHKASDAVHRALTNWALCQFMTGLDIAMREGGAYQFIGSPTHL